MATWGGDTIDRVDTLDDVDAFIAEHKRLKIADRRARFVVGIARGEITSFYKSNGYVAYARYTSSEAGNVADARWWTDALTSVDRARLILAAGGLAW